MVEEKCHGFLESRVGNRILEVEFNEKFGTANRTRMHSISMLPAVAFGQQAAKGLFNLPANVQNAVTYEFRGIAKEKKGDLNGAIADYDQAIRIGPKFSVPYYSRGMAKQKKGDLNGALADYNQAIQLNPKNASAFINRGNVKLRKGDLNGATGDYNQAIKLNPKYGLAYRNRGLAKQKKGDLDGAIADFNQAIKLGVTTY